MKKIYGSDGEKYKEALLKYLDTQLRMEKEMQYQLDPKQSTTIVSVVSPPAPLGIGESNNTPVLVQSNIRSVAPRPPPRSNSTPPTSIGNAIMLAGPINTRQLMMARGVVQDTYEDTTYEIEDTQSGSQSKQIESEYSEESSDESI
jgi:hypothetical protein